MIYWIDSEDGTRGGSIYIKMFHRYMVEASMKSTYIVVRSLAGRIKLIGMSWLHQSEVRGTVPKEIPTMLFCRRTRGYIQSPMEEWSLLSRIGLWVLVRVSGDRGRFVCVSKTTKRSAEAYFCGVLDVEYAKLDTSSSISFAKKRVTDQKELVLVVMDNELIDKGYLRHLSIVEAIADDSRVIVEVYGRKGGSGYSVRGKTIYNGFKENPFEDARTKNEGKRIFYLGCSRFEGLHMAVVEAAIAGVPSVLSDIPAHRELEKIAGKPLMIGRDISENISMLKRVIKDDNYSREVKSCECLAKRFGKSDTLGSGL